MAPILKEADSSVATASPAAPASSLTKSPTETPSRPQPVAIEIPVTVNGARTVEGSDKREPFSETTQTVLVFAQGAVVRIATPLASGQLIFLTNEKTRKEVVCQVIKAKSGGSAGAYVELQFTEPAPGFWGLKAQGGPVASAVTTPAAARPAAHVIPAAPKMVPPTPSVAAKPIAPEPAAPPPFNTHQQQPTAGPPASEPQAPSILVAPPPPAPVVAQPPAAHIPAPEFAIPQPPPPPADVIPPPPVLPKPTLPPAPLGDYAKEIEALFATPHTQTDQTAPPKHAEGSTIPGSSTSSSDELKLQAARLQAQLGSMLFTETPAASKTDPSLTQVARKVVEFSQDIASPAQKPEPKPAPPTRKPVTPSLSMDDEVKIPAWLAPLSQNPEPSTTENSAASDGAAQLESGALVSTSDSFATAGSSERPETAVFGGQLLGESSGQQGQTASGGSRKGLFIGLAVTVLLGAAVGGWYYLQTKPSIGHPAPARTGSFPSSGPQVAASTLPATKAASAQTLNAENSPVSSQPVRNTTSIPNVEPVRSSAASRNSNPAPADPAPTESSRKPSLGDVRLAAPVVSRGAASSENNEPLPSIQTGVSSSGTEDLAAAAASHRKEPAIPAPIGGDVKAAQLVKSVAPIYPVVARTQHISGNVDIDALIDESGNVSAVKVLSGPTLLHRAALDAVKQWKYTPALLDGKPTSMHLTITVQFRTQ